MKRLSRVIIIIAMTLVSLAAVSCGEESDDALLTGVFTKTGVDLGEGFWTNGTLAFSDGKLCVVGELLDDNSPAMAVVNTADMTVSVEKLPTSGSASDLAVGNDAVLCVVNRFDEEAFRTVFTLECVKDGNVVFSLAADDVFDLGENFWGNVLAAAGDGCWYAAGNKTFAVISSDGTTERTEELPEQASGIAVDRNGTLHVWGMGYHMILSDGRLENSSEWLDAAGSGSLFFGEGHDFYRTDENGIGYGDLTENGVDTGEIMNFVNSSLVGSGNRKLVLADPETIYMYGSDGVGGERGLWKYTKTDDRLLTDMKVVKVTYIENGRNIIPLAAVKFNQSQNEYYIKCEEYASKNSTGDWQSLMSRLDADIVAGKVGDIISMSDPDSITKYASKGLFTDLYELPGFGKDKIFGCVSEAMERDGILAAIPQEFVLNTLAVQKGTVGEDFDVGKIIELAKNSGGKRLFMAINRAAVNGQLLNSVLNECVDVSAGKCDFSSGAFTDYLDYLMTLPENDEDAMYDGANHYAAGEIMFYQARIGAISDYAMTMNIFGDAGADICGYPSRDGGRAELSAGSYYSVVKKSRVKDGAAAFLNYLLSPDCTIDDARGMREIPSLKATMKAWEESEGKMYYYFYKNNINRWSADTNPIDETEMGEPGVCVKVDRELFDSFYEYLDGAHVFGNMPQSITDIVVEEMDAFLSSAKSASETADIISNRVSLYLSEKN
ncbi:MAG: extracellular solute-binding protein [Eubacteriales bacterium]|nr:extracellular solute-binding protein [Eubacteriales bacterium]